MDKPKKHTKEFLVWSECVNYIEKKYGIQIRDFSGKFHPKYRPEQPYHDFWHWIVEFSGPIHNGCFMLLTKDMLEYDKLEDWQRYILNLFLDEFAEPDPYCEMAAEFWVSW